MNKMGKRGMIIEDSVAAGTTNVLLVEDHASFRQALAVVFDREQEFIVVAQAGSLSEARGLLEGVLAETATEGVLRWVQDMSLSRRNKHFT